MFSLMKKWLTVLSVVLMVTGHAHAGKAVQFQKQQSNDHESALFALHPLSPVPRPKTRLEHVIYFSSQASTNTEPEFCNITSMANTELRQIFDKTCPFGEVEDVLHVFPPGLLEQTVFINFNITWEAPFSLKIDRPKCPDVCNNSCFGENSDLDGACFCVDIFFKPVETNLPQRLDSKCGILEEWYEFMFRPEHGDLACGSLEFVVFGVNPAGNGSSATLSAGLSRPRASSIRPDTVEAPHTFLFNLPGSFGNTTRPKVVNYACQEEQVSSLPSSRTVFFTNNTLAIQDENNIDNSSFYNIDVFGILLDPPSGFPDALSPPEVSKQVCATIQLVRELLVSCDNQTINVITPETTRADTTLPDTTLPDTTLPDTTLPDTTLPANTTSRSVNIGIIVGGSAAALIVAGLVIGIPAGIGVVMCIRKKRSFDVPQPE